ncbi:MAG: ABC transporter ATP-binding protein [Anaerolineae bacterium]
MTNTALHSDAAPMEVAPPPQADMRWLLRFIDRHRWAAIGSLVAGMFGGITAAATPYLIGTVVDHINAGIHLEQILLDVLLLLGMAVLTVVFFYGQRVWSGTVAYAVNYDIRETLFDNLLTLEQEFYQSYATGDLISRMHMDVQMIWRLMLMAFSRGGSAVMTTIIAFVLLATIDSTLTLTVFVVLVISTSVQMGVGTMLGPVFEKVQEQEGALAALAQDAFSGIQTIKAFGKQTGVKEAYRQQNLEYRRRWLYFRRRNEPIGMLPNAISQGTTGLVVLFGGILTIQGHMTIGNFAQFISFLALISRSLLEIGTIYQRLQQTRGALVRLTPLLTHAHIASKPQARPLAEARGQVTFDKVTLNMDGTCLLDNVSLEIPAGTVVGLVGATGSGKTKLVNLLARVNDPTRGRVLVDGVDVRDYDLEQLRDVIAYVPQSTFLFSKPLHENVRMGRTDLGQDELERSLHIARVSNDLPQLPFGLETLVGEKGVMLSGGQKQRVAIARAIIRDPAILVLDDALSSVDTHTAADILADLRDVVQTRTSFIIAHRMATVKDADLIVVMEDGHIVEQGKHDDLLARDGLYAQMVARELQEELSI